MQLLTKSRLGVLADCARKHWASYERGYRPIREGDALVFGTAWHRAMASYWETLRSLRESAPGAGVDPVVLLLDVGLATLAVCSEISDPFVLARAQALYDGYVRRWAREDLERWDVLAVEEEFRAPLQNPATGGTSRSFRLAGKFDARAIDLRRNLAVLVEHKTTSDPVDDGSRYWLALRMDPQGSAYWLGAESCRERWRAERGAAAAAADDARLESILYDVVRKPQHEPMRATPVEDRKWTKATAKEPSRLYAGQRLEDESPDAYRIRVEEAIAADPDRYYARQHVYRDEESVREFLADANARAQAILASRKTGVHPRNPAACFRFGSCEYYLACSTGADLSTLPTLEARRTRHPELTLSVDELASDEDLAAFDLRSPGEPVAITIPAGAGANDITELDSEEVPR